MTSLTFYGAINEIGGNKFLLEDKDTKIFLDFGMCFARKGLFYEEYLQPRVANGIGDFFAMGLLPDIQGIYRDDLLEMIGRKSEKPIIDAVLLTHAHADHANYACFLHEDIPVYCGECTHLILRAINETAGRNIESEVIDFKRRPIVDRRAMPIGRMFATFSTGEKMSVGNLGIEPVHVDHSVPGAYGYIIHTSEGTIVYTGDLRAHGLRADMTNEFIEKAAEEKPDVLICEGTRVGIPVHYFGEQEVKTRSLELISKTKKFVCADFNFKDVDRFQTFYEIAKKTDRKIVLYTKDACMLDYLNKDEILKKKLPRLDDENIIIFLQKRKTGRYDLKDYEVWERKYLQQDNVWKAEDINKNQDKVIIMMNFFRLNSLIDIKPEPESIYIHSHSEPLNEEMKIDDERLDNWLAHFKFKEFEYNPKKERNERRFHCHASGHANEREIKEIIEKIKPKVVYPVHTEHPVMFKDLVKDARVECPVNAC